MRTITYVLSVFIAIIVLYATAMGQDGYYYYAFGERNDMIINREYIAVKIDGINFAGWDDIYNSETSLSDSEPPKYLTDNIYRLKVGNLAETDNLVNSIAGYDGIVEANYSFLTEDGMDYYLGKNLEMKFKEDISKQIIDSIIEVNGLEIIKIPKLVPTMYRLGSDNLTKSQLINLGNRIYEGGFTEFAVMSFITKPVLFSAQNDTYYPDQYSLHSDHCDFEEAYEYTLTDDTILVAFLDSGLEPHEDFPADRIKCGRNYVTDPYSADYSLSDNCYQSAKSCFHGLATVGIFGATINNSMGIAGAINNTQVIMNKILEDGVYVYNEDINEAFQDAVDSGAVIISNSWGYNSCMTNNVWLFVYIHEAYLDGVLVIFSAGNCNSPPPYCGDCVFDPADHPYVIAVGATTEAGGRWEYSAFDYNNNDIDVCAPGDNMYILDQMGADGLATSKYCLNENYNCGLEGTSYAAPLVSGLAAMIMARRPDFIGQPDSIKQIIYYSTGNGWSHPDSSQEDSHTKTNQMGYGRINAARAMLAISRGDVNNDVAIDMLDIVYMIEYKYEGGKAPYPNPLLGDAECNGVVNISNIIYLINYIYKGGSRPPLCYKY